MIVGLARLGDVREGPAEAHHALVAEGHRPGHQLGPVGGAFGPRAVGGPQADVEHEGHQHLGVETLGVRAAVRTERAEDVLALADMLMYDAKDAGRDRFTVLDDSTSVQPRSGARMEWKARIEAALENDDFELYLQPLLHLDSGRVTSAEALILDPQTSGGLLAAVDPGVAADLVAAGFWSVGTIEAGAPTVVLR